MFDVEVVVLDAEEAENRSTMTANGATRPVR
jgi:hypothetical protein